jgi:glycosyltransferase involved in cell wall biosynthesis
VTDPVAMRRRIDEIVQKLGLEDCVSVVEMEAPEKHEPYFAASDLLVAPFESELFSSVNLIEAMVFGRAHVVTDLGEPADIVNRWSTGLKVPPRSPVALAEAMLTLARNPSQREALSQRARSASIDFGVDAVAERLTGLYARLADPQHAQNQQVGEAV